MTYNELQKEIALQLQELRLSRNLTLVDLEAETGVSRSSLSAIERGARSPSLHTLQVLLDFYSVSFAYFFKNL